MPCPRCLMPLAAPAATLRSALGHTGLSAEAIDLELIEFAKVEEETRLRDDPTVRWCPRPECAASIRTPRPVSLLQFIRNRISLYATLLVLTVVGACFPQLWRLAQPYLALVLLGLQLALVVSFSCSPVFASTAAGWYAKVFSRATRGEVTRTKYAEGPSVSDAGSSSKPPEAGAALWALLALGLARDVCRTVQPASPVAAVLGKRWSSAEAFASAIVSLCVGALGLHLSGKVTVICGTLFCS